MIDVTGRIILSRDAKIDSVESSICVSTTGMVPGVYVLRLINGEDVRTQKVVVR